MRQNQQGRKRQQKLVDNNEVVELQRGQWGEDTDTTNVFPYRITNLIWILHSGIIRVWIKFWIFLGTIFHQKEFISNLKGSDPLGCSFLFRFLQSGTPPEGTREDSFMFLPFVKGFLLIFLQFEPPPPKFFSRFQRNLPFLFIPPFSRQKWVDLPPEMSSKGHSYCTNLSTLPNRRLHAKRNITMVNPFAGSYGMAI